MKNNKVYFPVDAIARNVGFANVKYYYVLFKKYTGQTPAAYRAGEEPVT